MLKSNNGIYFFKDGPIEIHFTTRQYPVIKSEKQYESIIKNILPEYTAIYTTKQIHSSIINITRGKGFYMGDGLVTKCSNEVLAIFTADCYPIVIYSLNPPLISLVHAGWKGIYRGIIPNTVNIMKNNFKLGELKAFTGPGICKKCYSVGENMKNYFSSVYFSKIDDSLCLDLKSVISTQLKEAGITDIIHSGFCTVCNNDQFYSYRAENKTNNRILTFAYIKKKVQ